MAHSTSPVRVTAGNNTARKSGAARRSQAERTEAMRARLSIAAYQIVARGGLNALRMRNVAEEAGVSQGALLHHFPDKNAIVLATIETALDLALQDSEPFVVTTDTRPRDVLKAMMEEFRTFFFSDRFWVAMGITMDAAKDKDFFPIIRKRVGKLRTPVYAAWAERLVEQGWDERRAVRDVRSGSALLAGLSVRRFWADSDTISDDLVDEWIEDRLAKH